MARRCPMHNMAFTWTTHTCNLAKDHANITSFRPVKVAKVASECAVLDPFGILQRIFGTLAWQPIENYNVQ